MLHAETGPCSHVVPQLRAWEKGGREQGCNQDGLGSQLQTQRAALPCCSFERPLLLRSPRLAAGYSFLCGVTPEAWESYCGFSNDSIVTVGEMEGVWPRGSALLA